MAGSDRTLSEEPPWPDRRGPYVLLVDASSNLEAELIVVGTHGHGAVYDVLIGSYSAGIIRKSKLPVLVVPVRDS